MVILITKSNIKIFKPKIYNKEVNNPIYEQ